MTRRKDPTDPPPTDAAGHFRPHVEGVDYGALDRLVGYAVRRAQILIYEDFLAALAPWKITPPRFAALELIARNPGMKQSDLAHILGVARSGVVALADDLGALGYVERAPSPDDRRAYRLTLTPAGAMAVRDIGAAVAAHDARVTKRLTPAECASLINLLDRIGAEP